MCLRELTVVAPVVWHHPLRVATAMSSALAPIVCVWFFLVLCSGQQIAPRMDTVMPASFVPRTLGLAGSQYRTTHTPVAGRTGVLKAHHGGAMHYHSRNSVSPSGTTPLRRLSTQTCTDAAAGGQLVVTVDTHQGSDSSGCGGIGPHAIDTPCQTLGFALAAAERLRVNTSVPAASRPGSLLVRVASGSYTEAQATVTMPTTIEPASGSSNPAVSMTCTSCPALVVSSNTTCLRVRRVSFLDAIAAGAVHVQYVSLRCQRFQLSVVPLVSYITLFPIAPVLFTACAPVSPPRFPADRLQRVMFEDARFVNNIADVRPPPHATANFAGGAVSFAVNPSLSPSSISQDFAVHASFSACSFTQGRAFLGGAVSVGSRTTWPIPVEVDIVDSNFTSNDATAGAL